MFVYYLSLCSILCSIFDFSVSSSLFYLFHISVVPSVWPLLPLIATERSTAGTRDRRTRASRPGSMVSEVVVLFCFVVDVNC